MAAVSDNITNINTVGYKTEDTQFRTLVSDGRSGAKYSAGGVSSVSHSLVSQEGVLGASSSSTDLGIKGAGFFVTRDGADANANIAYTRAGSFSTDEDGYLKNSGGYYLQGWPLDAQGIASNTDVSSLVPIRVSQLSGTAAATTKLNMSANLDQTATAVTSYSAGDLAADPTKAQFKKSFDITDSQGGTHSVTLAFVKTGTNAWAGEIYTTVPAVAAIAADPTAVPPVAAVPAVPAHNQDLRSGAVLFNTDGTLDLAHSNPAMFGTIPSTVTNGAVYGPIALGLGTDGGTDGLTQYASTSAMKSYSIDGGLLGKVASTNVSEDGVVSAVFDDGTSRAVFKLPIASFQNADGLTRLPGNAYQVSNESGGAAINPAGAFGGGKIESKVLEASTVDLAQEFTNMIRFQRAYSASSKIITTVDEMLQEVSNLKR